MTREPNPELERFLLGEPVNWEAVKDSVGNLEEYREKLPPDPIVDGETAEKAFAMSGNLEGKIKGTNTTYREISSFAKRHGVQVKLNIHHRGIVTTRNVLVPADAGFEVWNGLVTAIRPPATWRFEEDYIRLHYD